MRAASEETGRRSVTIGRNGRMGGHLRTIGQVVEAKERQGMGEKGEGGTSPSPFFLLFKERNDQEGVFISG